MLIFPPIVWVALKFIYSTILKQLSFLLRSHNAEERSIFKTEAYFLDFAVTIHIMRPLHQRSSCTFLVSYWFIRVSLACVDNPLNAYLSICISLSAITQLSRLHWIAWQLCRYDHPHKFFSWVYFAAVLPNNISSCPKYCSFRVRRIEARRGQLLAE